MRLPFNGDYPLTQRYGHVLILTKPDGTKVNVYAQWGLKGHNGVDWGLPSGTVVVSPHDGKVLEAAFDANGYGNYIKIENDTEGSVLAHLESINVTVGQHVQEGQQVATSDNTGYSTGAHLHWGYYQKPRNHANGFNGYIDQRPVLAASTAPSSGTTAPVTGQLYTKEQYDSVLGDREKFWKERDEEIKKNKLLGEQLIAATAQLSEFRAAGYNSVDEVKAALSPLQTIQAHGYLAWEDIERELITRDQKIAGVNRELVQVLDRNKVLLDQLAKKETEDSTAIQVGIDSMEKLTELQENMARVHKATGVTPEKGIMGIFNLIQYLKELKNRKPKEVEVTPAMTPVAAAVATTEGAVTIPVAPKRDLSWWLRYLGFTIGIFTVSVLPWVLIYN